MGKKGSCQYNHGDEVFKAITFYKSQGENGLQRSIIIPILYSGPIPRFSATIGGTPFKKAGFVT
jgi:hypothetical protein